MLADVQTPTSLCRDASRFSDEPNLPETRPESSRNDRPSADEHSSGAVRSCRRIDDDKSSADARRETMRDEATGPVFLGG